jgi:hypothetical protein
MRSLEAYRPIVRSVNPTWRTTASCRQLCILRHGMRSAWAATHTATPERPEADARSRYGSRMSIAQRRCSSRIATTPRYQAASSVPTQMSTASGTWTKRVARKSAHLPGDCYSRRDWEDAGDGQRKTEIQQDVAAGGVPGGQGAGVATTTWRTHRINSVQSLEIPARQTPIQTLANGPSLGLIRPGGKVGQAACVDGARI